MAVTISSVQVEHHESGFGIGVAKPRISWRFTAEDSVRDWTQIAYELILRVNDGQEDTYTVESPQSVLVPWPGAELASRTRVKVTVRAKGGDGVWTEPRSLDFEVALLHREDWSASTIAGPVQPREEPKRPVRFRGTVMYSGTGRARLYATSYGIYEIEVNGRRISDQLLNPGWTSYRHLLNYQTYDLGPYLREGENVIGAYVGEGWYATRLGRPGERCLYGDRLGFLGQIEVNGKVVAHTNDSWEWMYGPVVSSELYDGEVFDSAQADASWTTSPALGKVECLPFPSAILRSSDIPPVRRVMEIPVKETITTPSGKTVFDFGQNLVGWARVNRDLTPGPVVIRHAEVLEHGELGVRPLRTAKATATLTGGKTKGWEPRFTFFGFRYIEVEGAEVAAADFTAIVVSSDLRRTGEFECSHASINQLHANVVWSTRGNFVTLPTDCPQRDERLGWTGDICVFAPTANYLFDTAGFLDNWLRDVHAETLEYDGVCPEMVPWIYAPLQKGRSVRPMGVWADVTVLGPWDMYRSTGDASYLERGWDSMVAWLEKGVPRGPHGLYDHAYPQFGDWLDPRAPPAFPAHGQTDCHLVCDAYMVHATRTVARIARRLGKDDRRWTREAEELQQKFAAEYISQTGRMMSDTQTAIALALTFDLISEKQKEHAVQRLEYLCKWDAFRISTGFAGTPIILNALADNGLLHIAYRMLQEAGCPSWLYPVQMGATTIWERWDSMLADGSINPGQMTSFNHYALGAVADFLHTVVGGLAPDTSERNFGWARAIVQPRPGGTIRWASTSHDGPHGRYACAWRIGGGRLEVTVDVPPAGRALVKLPGEVDQEIGSGRRVFDVPWEEDTRWPPKPLPTPSSSPSDDNFIP